jgi:hypothetical protein
MLKAIHAAEDRAAAQTKAQQVIEKVRAMKLKEAAKKIEDSILETLAYYDFPETHGGTSAPTILLSACYGKSVVAPGSSAPSQMDSRH